MKLLIFTMFLTSCAINPRYGVYRKTICEDDRYGNLQCDNGQEYYKAYEGISVYDEPSN